MLVPSINWGTSESKDLLKGPEENRNQEETPSFLLHMHCTGQKSMRQGTYPAVSKNVVALFHQDVFDKDGVQNSHHRLPAIIKPKPGETHSQSILHGQLEQRQPALSMARVMAQSVWGL